MNGYIRTYRSLLDWEWYGHPDMVALWVHLLLTANYNDGCYRGIELKRGQVLTGRRELARKTGLTERQVRTCLQRLISSHEVTIKATHKYSIITICKYDSYQAQRPTSDPLSDPLSYQQTPTVEEDNNKKNNSTVLGARARLEDDTINNSLWLDKTSVELRSTNIMQIAIDVMNEWELTLLPESEWTALHLYNHIRKKLDISKREGKPTKQEAKENRRTELKGLSINDMISLQQNGNYQQQTGNNGVNRHA